MNFAELAIGVGALVLAFLALWVALPGPDRKVKRWLVGDWPQAGYVVAILGIAAFGLVNIITGVVPDSVVR
jgi:hypothetical protein